MMKSCSKSILSLLVLGLCAAWLAGCTTVQPKPGETFACGPVDEEICAEAELAALTCEFKTWEGADVLHFNVAVKNLSDQPQRFKVNLFLDNGKAVGGLLPRKTKKGLIAPGQTASFTYPVGGMTTAPESVALMIKTMGR